MMCPMRIGIFFSIHGEFLKYSLQKDRRKQVLYIKKYISTWLKMHYLRRGIRVPESLFLGRPRQHV